MTIEIAELGCKVPSNDEMNEFYDPQPMEDIVCDEVKYERGSDDSYRTNSSSESSSQFFDTSPFQSSQDSKCTDIEDKLSRNEDIEQKSIIVSTEERQLVNTKIVTPQISNSSSIVSNISHVNQDCTSNEFCTRTEQFLDIIDLALGRKPVSGYSILKDRISTLMRNATRKKWGNSQGPRWTGLGVVNIIHKVESRSKKKTEPELIRRERFIPKKGGTRDIEAARHAGLWKTEVSKDKYANIPEPSFADKLRSHMNTIFTAPIRHSQKGKDFDNLETIAKRRKLDEMGIVNESQESEDHTTKSRFILTSLCKNIEDSGFNFQEMENENQQDLSKDLDEENQQPSKPTPINFVERTQVIINVDENEGKIDEDTEISFSVTSINDYLATQINDSTGNAVGTNLYFIEEECVMLSPYSNEAKLYKLLFPGRRLPLHEGNLNMGVQCETEETVTEFESCETVMVESCIITTVQSEELFETAKVEDSLPTLTSSFTDDMWVSESDEEAAEPDTDPIKAPSPELVREPTPEPIHQSTPESESVPKTLYTKKEKRKKPEKKKKVYDRNFVKAVQSNQSGNVQELLYEGADPNTTCSIGTVLHQAAQLGFPYTLQILLWGGSDTETRNELGDTALHLAAISGNTEIVFMLTTYGCDVDAGNNYEITPLHMALSYGRLDVIQILVRMDADPYTEDKIGDTPHILSKQLGYDDDVLNSSAAEIGPIKTIPIRLKLVHAVENGSLEQVKLALTQKAAPNTIVPLALHWPGHSTVLHRAAHLGLTAIVRTLLCAGSNVNARDMVGNTPLHTAVQDGHNEVVRVLLDGGAFVNAYTKSGVTPLHRAAAKGHESTMKLLVQKGGDLTITDNQNRTPIDWARQKGFMVVARNMIKQI